MIHQTGPNRFVISSRQIWLPGIYDSERTARYAFRFPNKTLQDIQNAINPNGVITLELLRRAKDKAK